ncbi:MAG: DinB family protein [Bacteroidetes bacterium]|nr:DinB family protein [Bacteroidota bacterium]
MNDNIQLLKYMLEDVREVTMKGVSHLSKEQLFAEPVKGEYPIGAYLMHLAECEIYWLEVISGNAQPEELKKRAYANVWYDPYETSVPPETAPEITEYKEVLDLARKNFLDYVLTLKDSELAENVTVKRERGDIQFSKKWIIYHIIEHEAHHRGQMFMLMRMAGMNKK